MKICIIGGGASAVIILHEIKRRYHKFKDYSITIYEKRPVVGPGLAYDQSNGRCILNTSPSKMGLGEDKYDYLNWCLVENKNELLRKNYGKYLAFKFSAISAWLCKHDITVHFKQEIVEEISITAGLICIKTQLAERRYNLGIIASGGSIHEPFGKLRKSARYLPFLHFSDFDSIIENKAATVGIIGTNQSAVDASLMLKDKGYKGKLILFSRSGMLPRVKPDHSVNRHHEQLYKLVKNNSISIKKIIDLFTHTVADSALIENKNRRQFTKDIEDCRKNPPDWYELMSQLTPHIIDLWRGLPERERFIFKSKFLKITQRLRGGIPLFSGEKILKLISEGRLTIIKGINDVQVAKGGFSINSQEAGQLTVDYIINAAGVAADEVTKIIHGLIEKGKATMNKYGGINVDLLSNRVINADGACIDELYAIGYPTRGSCVFINAVEFLQNFAEVIINNIADRKTTFQGETLVQNSIP